MSAPKRGLLARLGVFGFEQVETVVLTALVTEDPLLLLGRPGTGKTYLLNTLSEALGLEHRHYNASLISFDDLVGFPYPEEGAEGVRFLQTPATVWGAESVLIDEISRCKPEHQNRLFSLVHERRIQGIAIEGLRYRWAAMNPCGDDASGGEVYTGSEPLDPALADRFGLIVEVADWEGLDEAARAAIANPAGEGRVTAVDADLVGKVAGWRERFERSVERCPAEVIAYAVAAASALGSADVRVSPRRSRLLARSLLAATLVEGRRRKRTFRQILGCSLPHPCWGHRVPVHVIDAAHEAAWAVARDRRGGWIHRLHSERSLSKKLELLLTSCEDPDQGDQAIAELLASEPRCRAAAFAFATYPAAAQGALPIGAQGISDLGKVASPLLSTDGTITWQERLGGPNTVHPDRGRYARVVEGLRGARAERARQFFDACLVEGIDIPDPKALEREIHACVRRIGKLGLR